MTYVTCTVEMHSVLLCRWWRQTIFYVTPLDNKNVDYDNKYSSTKVYEILVLRFSCWSSMYSFRFWVWAASMWLAPKSQVIKVLCSICHDILSHSFILWWHNRLIHLLVWNKWNSLLLPISPLHQKCIFVYTVPYNANYYFLTQLAMLILQTFRRL